jgi:hypothetical protein
MHGSRTTNARCTCGELIFIMSACLYHNDGATHFFRHSGLPPKISRPKHAVQGNMGDLCLITVIVRTT